MTPPFLSYEDTYDALSWEGAVEALRAGHLRAKAEVGDVFLGPSDGTLLTRAAYVPGLGYGVKAVTVFGENPARGLPTVQGAMFFYEPDEGRIEAVIDSRLVTEFKTAGDSVLGARLLARPDSKALLIVGAGTVARSLVHAYSAIFPDLERISIWARRPDQAEALAAEFVGHAIAVSVAPDLAAAAEKADIVATATMAKQPVLRRDWIAPGTHVDLIGAFKPDMREADDALIAEGRLFVDSRETTVHHIGELTMPIAAGVISEDAVLADFYDLIAGSAAGRTSDDDITVFKNGGGAHLDLMTADYIVRAAKGAAE